MDPFAIANNTGNGDIVILEFEILRDAAPGEYALELACVPGNVINADIERVTFGLAHGSVTVEPAPQEPALSLVSAAASFISIAETAKNSKVWVLSFKVTEKYSNGETKIVPYAVSINANNANIDGRYNLGAYTLIYEIKGNGSNIKEFRVVMN